MTVTTQDNITFSSLNQLQSPEDRFGRSVKHSVAINIF